MTAKVIVLPISPGYIDHWSLAEGIREWISNCSDAVGRNRELMEFIYDERDDGLIDLCIGNKIVDGKLEPKHLVLGVSENRDKSEAIGQFGEGMKLAFITLLRNNVPVHVENDDEFWAVELKEDATFGTELPHITITQRESTGYVRFFIKGITQQTLVDVMSMVWEFLPVGEFEFGDETTQVRYMFEDDEAYSGLFVGGIYMGELHPRLAINTSPTGVPVNRDRKLPDNLEVLRGRVEELVLTQFNFSGLPKLANETEERNRAFLTIMEALDLFQEYTDIRGESHEYTPEEVRKIWAKNDVNLWLARQQIERTLGKNLDEMQNMFFCNDYQTANANGYRYIDWTSEERMRRLARRKRFQWLDSHILKDTAKPIRTIYNEMLSNVYSVLKESGVEVETAKEQTRKLLEDLRIFCGSKERTEWDF